MTMPTFQKIKWEDRTLSSLGFLGRGKSKHRPRNAPSLYGGNYPFIQTSDIKHANFYVNSYSQTYNEIGLKQSKLWEKDTLCMTIAANIAETALLSFPACFPDSIVGFVADPKKSNVKFVKYALDLAKKSFQNRAQGAAQDNLSLEKIDNLKISIPDLKNQTRIASVLSAYDDLIENNEKRIKHLEEMSQLLYTEWFVKFKFPGHEKVKMVDSGIEYGMVPEGWKFGSLENVSGLFKNKYVEKKDFSLPLVDMARINSRSLIITNIGKASDLSTSRIIFEKGDILFGSIRPYLHKVALAPFKGITNISVFVLRAKEEYLKSFQTIVLFSDATIRWANGHSTGTKMPVIKWKFFKQMPLLIPKKEILVQFENKLGLIFECINQLSIKNNSLSRIRDLLIPQLVTGKRELK
jgi:type I restriction enzyme S subunit